MNEYIKEYIKNHIENYAGISEHLEDIELEWIFTDRQEKRKSIINDYGSLRQYFVEEPSAEKKYIDEILEILEYKKKLEKVVEDELEDIKEIYAKEIKEDEKGFMGCV